MAKVNGALKIERWDKGKGQWGGVGPWVKGDTQGLNPYSDITQKYS